MDLRAHVHGTTAEVPAGRKARTSWVQRWWGGGSVRRSRQRVTAAGASAVLLGALVVAVPVAVAPVAAAATTTNDLIGQRRERPHRRRRPRTRRWRHQGSGRPEVQVHDQRRQQRHRRPGGAPRSAPGCSRRGRRVPRELPLALDQPGPRCGAHLPAGRRDRLRVGRTRRPARRPLPRHHPRRRLQDRRHPLHRPDGGRRHGDRRDAADPAARRDAARPRLPRRGHDEHGHRQR